MQDTLTNNAVFSLSAMHSTCPLRLKACSNVVLLSRNIRLLEVQSCDWFFCFSTVSYFFGMTKTWLSRQDISINVQCFECISFNMFTNPWTKCAVIRIAVSQTCAVFLSNVQYAFSIVNIHLCMTIQHAFMNKCSLLNQCMSLELSSAAVDKPVFCARGILTVIRFPWFPMNIAISTPVIYHSLNEFMFF